jgi:hypothetical protein
VVVEFVPGLGIEVELEAFEGEDEDVGHFGEVAASAGFHLLSELLAVVLVLATEGLRFDEVVEGFLEVLLAFDVDGEAVEVFFLVLDEGLGAFEVVNCDFVAELASEDIFHLSFVAGFLDVTEETEEEFCGVLLDTGVDRFTIEFHMGDELFGVDDIFDGVAEFHENIFELFEFIG